MRRTLFAVTLVLAGFLAGLVLTGRFRTAEESYASPAPPEAAVPASAPQAVGPSGLPDFSTVAARAVPGIVNISSVSMVRTSNSPFANDPFFSQLFGGDDDLFGSRYRPQASLGSGVVIRADGYVVTNNHVVSGNVREITAVLSDKRQVDGQIVARDPDTDIAVVRLAARGLPVAAWGDSSKLRVGQWVLAIGSPFQLNQTVTLGIVSAVGRTGVGVADYEDFIQTDAAINPGNSGGGLFDAKGDLVGINTAILSQSGGYQGVGFAVPSNLARRIADDLIKYGEVRRGSMGAVRLVTMNEGLASQYDLQNAQGVLVYQLHPDSSAYNAGVQPGDIIVAFNGQKVSEDSQLRKLLADARIGSTAVLDVLRQGRSVQLRVPITAPTARRRAMR
jgi:Do/DeqQ family serine protease